MPGNDGSAAALLRGIDRAAFAVALASRLRRAGVAVSLANIESFTRALAVCPPDPRSRLYWLARICLVHRPADLEVFDAVFASVFDDAVLGIGPHARHQPARPTPSTGDDVFSPAPVDDAAELDGGGLPWITLPTVTGTAGDSDVGLGVPERLPSNLDGLADTPFDELDAGELALLGDWLSSALQRWPTRRTRRQACHPAGRRVALRPTLARARRTGWEPVVLVRNSPVHKPRRLVMLCDVSQSMQAHATAYLHLMRAAALGTDAEVFAFATALTRLTPVLAHTSASVAIEQATAKVTDRFGGTRIASNVRALLASHHGGTVRNAIVIIASDGWDSDEPVDLASAMARLRRRAYRVIWLNPRVAAPGFAPSVGGMGAALPYCDDLLPAHNIRALADVVTAAARPDRHRE